MNGRCLPANQFPECDDRELDYIREVTRLLAEAQHFCANGAGVYRAETTDPRGVCIREALVCHPNRRDAIPAVCSNGYTLTKELECVLASVPCPYPPEYITPIRQFLLRRMCQAEQTLETRMPSKQLEHNSCTSWYVTCSPQPSVIHCKSGEVFDVSLRKCRRWTTSDTCAISEVCRDHEWQSVPLGECQSQFVYCEGSRGRLYTCAEGLVLSDGHCRPRQTVRKCAVCRMKERRPARSCDECVHGSSFPINCRDYMYCTGEYYEMFSCPPNTRWNPQTKQCGYDPTCVSVGLQEFLARTALLGRAVVKWIISNSLVNVPRMNDFHIQKTVQHITFAKPDIGVTGDEKELKCVRGTCSLNEYGDQILPPPPNRGVVPAPPQAKYGVPEFVAPSCKGSFRIADQYDCARFWECGPSGRFQSMTCAPGTVYDHRTQQCVRGQCVAPTTCLENSFLPLEKCGHYKTCYNGQWIDARCQYGKRFVNGKCSSEDCDSHNYGENHYDQMKCRTGAVRPHPTNQRYYMFCQYGQWTERSCPEGALFNWKVLGCVLSQQQGPDYKPECYDGETRPVNNECSLYEECIRGQWTRRTCPYGQKFHNGFCIAGSCTGPSQYCRESSGMEGYRRVEHDCSKYYQCVHGKWMERPCGPGTVFNERISVCDHARNVPKCGGY
ncbi:unnamed protein product [Heligmosomoides polygyrus]|uniref:Chitin-binding type-2 domain-containing protein n=1 Tax=Heligmosomoides polygyrus TaxID=6339 RepID=A0A3P7XC10_HELPZ|nr:unnamed protein product [Heligmosomoides polygyrus]